MRPLKPRTTTRLALASLLALPILSACGGDEDGSTGADPAAAGGGAPYFSPSNFESQLNRLDAYDRIVGLHAEATPDNAAESFEAIQRDYEGDHGLAGKVAGRQDDHAYGPADIGVAMDAGIRAAIASAKASTDAGEIKWAGQVVDKTLQRFFYLSVFHELQDLTRGHFDEAWGYSGLHDLQSLQGVAATASKREPEFGVVLVNPLMAAFEEAHDALAIALEGKGADEAAAEAPAAYVAAVAEIDRLMLLTFAHSVMHELDGYDGSDEKDVKLIEGRLYYDAIEPYVLNGVEGLDAATATWLRAQFDKDLAGIADGSEDVEDLARMKVEVAKVISALSE